MNNLLAGCALTQVKPDTPVNIVNAQTVGPEFDRLNREAMDGIDHINIERRGKTTLGRFLSNLSKSNFVHPEFGPFQSIEGFIGFIRSGLKDDQFRYIFGMKARYQSRNMETHFIPNFRDIVMEASYFKLVQNPAMYSEMRESTLPFDHYYLFENNNMPIRPRNAEWIIPEFEKLRTLIKNNEAFPKVDYSTLKIEQ